MLASVLDGTVEQTPWYWWAIGFGGQLIFGSRFYVQWLVSEREKRSVVPHVFWHLSVVASVLQLACFWQRQEWIFALGMIANIFVYSRNFWFNYMNRETSGSRAGIAQ